MKRIMIFLICLLVITLPVSKAENAQADLESRFGKQSTLEYNGKNYVTKKRSSTLMFAVCENMRLQLLYLIMVDDDANRIVPIQLNTLTVTEEYPDRALQNIYNMSVSLQEAGISPADANAQRLLSSVNSLFPEPLIENYLVLHVEGLSLLSEDIKDDPSLSSIENTKLQLKTVAATVMQASSSEQMDMADIMSAYLDTDIKTGAMMKIMDKSRKYEILPTQQISGTPIEIVHPIPKENELPIPTDIPRTSPVILDENAVISLAIEFFYEESSW